MKKLITTAACTMAAAAAFGQGLFQFQSTLGTQGQAPTAGVVNDNTIVLPNANGTAANPATGKPADVPYQAEVAIGTGTTLASMTLYPASISPLGGGYFFGPQLTVPGSAPGTSVNFDVLVWNPADGSTYAAAVAKAGSITGSSGVVTGYSLGGPNPAGGPPFTAGNPNFAGFSLSQTPEPTTLALGAMGLGALLLRRRK
jgi:hypothetical protein